MKISFKNIYRILKHIAVCFIVSGFLRKDVKILSVEILFTYISVLIGFSIAILTFGLSLVGPIKDLIIADTLLTDQEKDDAKGGILDGFFELREDVWIISFCLISVILIFILESFQWDIYKSFCFFNNYSINLDLIVYLKLCVLSVTTFSFFDLIRSLLTISDIMLTFYKRKP